MILEDLRGSGGLFLWNKPESFQSLILLIKRSFFLFRKKQLRKDRPVI
ncbi:hypothetical protein SAMN04487894_101640 [Niabella drilacis]|uniref:Uncharacterized protein n=1 Tax=Niabella drilacis (strain DSM 25811 / CCM 8410 / CCUG 62505 / LMG 26954 / E90) TaxID=1285928 RepID=A0A1G6JU99_NIADE|nr:hypothetical protein SAMN04487894_101640 [Niabella drilacis]